MNTKWKCRFNIVSKKKLERTANCGWIKTDSIVAECKFVKPRLASCAEKWAIHRNVGLISKAHIVVAEGNGTAEILSTEC